MKVVPSSTKFYKIFILNCWCMLKTDYVETTIIFGTCTLVLLGVYFLGTVSRVKDFFFDNLQVGLNTQGTCNTQGDLIYLSIDLSICLSVCLYVHLSVHPSIHPSSLSLCLSVLCVCANLGHALNLFLLPYLLMRILGNQ